MQRVQWALIALVLACILAGGMSPLIAAAAPAPEMATAGATPKQTPARYHLGQLKYSVQTLNNCGPAAVVSALSYYRVNVSQEQARKVLRPYTDSRGMTQTVIPPYVEQFGLAARVLVDGDREMIKALVANDIPVIVLQYISETWRTGHFRVVQGYDDSLGVFYVNDSLLGANLAISYASFDARWDYNWARYVPIYRPNQTALVDAILGPDAVKEEMFARRVPDLQAAVRAKPTDRQAWSRLVEALTEAGQYKAALDAVDQQASRGGLFGFGGGGSGNPSTQRIKILNKLERYSEALAAAESALSRQGSSSWGYGSLWFQKGEALRGLGRLDEARASYEKAVETDGVMSEAGLALKTLE